MAIKMIIIAASSLYNRQPWGGPRTAAVVGFALFALVRCSPDLPPYAATATTTHGQGDAVLHTEAKRYTSELRAD